MGDPTGGPAVGREGVKQRGRQQPNRGRLGAGVDLVCPQWMVRRRPCDDGLVRGLAPDLAAVRDRPAPLMSRRSDMVPPAEEMSDIAGAMAEGDDQFGPPTGTVRRAGPASPVATEAVAGRRSNGVVRIRSVLAMVIGALTSSLNGLDRTAPDLRSEPAGSLRALVSVI